MGIFNVLAFIWLGSVMMLGVKMVFDQYKLLKLIRKKIDPPYAIAPGEQQSDFSSREGYPGDDDLFGIKASARLTKTMFTNYSDKEIAKQAIKVRIEFALAIAIGIFGFFFISFIVFLLNNI